MRDWVDQDPQTRKDTQWTVKPTVVNLSSQGVVAAIVLSSEPSSNVPVAPTSPAPVALRGDAAARKMHPVFSGVLKYFPDAILAVANCSWVGNEQHNPGESLYWNRAKSTDEPDALVRHLMDPETFDTDGVRHRAKAAWRALAYLQKEIEAERG